MIATKPDEVQALTAAAIDKAMAALEIVGTHDDDESILAVSQVLIALHRVRLAANNLEPHSAEGA